MASKKIQELLGDQAEYYLNHTSKTFDKSLLHTPSASCADKPTGVGIMPVPTTLLAIRRIAIWISAVLVALQA